MSDSSPRTPHSPPRAPESGDEPPASSVRSELYSDMLDALTGVQWLAQRSDREVIDDETQILPRAEDGPASGDVLNGRYEVVERLRGWPSRWVFLADDRSTRQPVVIRLAPSWEGAAEEEALRTEMLLAQSVNHPNICRVHDLTPSEWGKALVMELPGDPLRIWLARRTIGVDDFRELAAGLAGGLEAIHKRRLVHGAFRPEHIVVRDGTPSLIGFGLVTERELLLTGRRGSAPPPDPTYYAPERLEGHGPSPADDVFALGLVLWEVATGRRTMPGFTPRQAMLELETSKIIGSLSTDELRVLFNACSDDPSVRPRASAFNFLEAPTLSARSTQLRSRIDPGPPPGNREKFTGGAQGLLVLWAEHQKDASGTLHPLNKPAMMVGRRDTDIVLRESTLSAEHALFCYREGAWQVSDRRTLNGTYSGDDDQRHDSVLLRHGGEVQLAEVRLMLVGFPENSPAHWRARRQLSKFHGVTGLPYGRHFVHLLEEEAEYVDWAGMSMHIAIYELFPESGPFVTAMAARRAARDIVETTEGMRQISSTAGHLARKRADRIAERTVITMIGECGVDPQAVKVEVEQRLSRVLPDGVILESTVVRRKPGAPIAKLIY